MKTAIEGLYNEGKVILNENVDYKGTAKVLVIFLDDMNENKVKKEKLLKTFGTWNDDKTSEQIIKDIYSSRVSRKENIEL